MTSVSSNARPTRWNALALVVIACALVACRRIDACTPFADATRAATCGVKPPPPATPGGRFIQSTDLDGLACYAKAKGDVAAAELARRMLSAPPSCFGPDERRRDMHRTELLAQAASLKSQWSHAWLEEAAEDGSEKAALAMALSSETERSKAESYLVEAADLGEPRALERLYRLTSQRAGGEYVYWALVMTALGDPRQDVILASPLTAPLWPRIRHAVTERSPAYRHRDRGVGPLDQRGLECTLVSDALLRRALGSAGRVAFSDDVEGDQPTVVDLLKNRQAALARITRRCRYFAFDASLRCVRGPGAACIAQEDVGAALLPHDEILVEYGTDAHTAMVWHVDDRRGEVVLLDPMSEFWRLFPESELRVTRETVYHSRTLVRVPTAQLVAHVRAIFGIRDSDDPARRAGMHPLP